MTRLRIALVFAASFTVIALCAGRLAAAEPACAQNYKTGGTTSETFVLTSLTPEAVVGRLPWLLAKAGVTVHWTQPGNGIIEAEGLDVKAEKSGDATRVTFRSRTEPPADRTTLCRYASLAESPSEAKKPVVAQDPALIERMKDDLLKWHAIVLPGKEEEGRRPLSLNNVVFSSPSNFLQFAVTDIKAFPAKTVYKVSMLLPRSICAIATEDIGDITMEMAGGRKSDPRTKPVRVEASMVYEGEGAASRLTDASIVMIESTK
jgi:hypothetical protein